MKTKVFFTLTCTGCVHTNKGKCEKLYCHELPNLIDNHSLIYIHLYVTHGVLLSVTILSFLCEGNLTGLPKFNEFYKAT